jgi:hypothetical protein
MSDYTAVGDVGASLLDVLWRTMHADGVVSGLIDSADRLSLKSPYELKDDNHVRLSVYLYRIVEDAYTKNQHPVPGTAGRLRKPPLTLDLHYLVTPLVGEPVDQQYVLGKVLQVLYDHATLAGPDLVGHLAGSAVELRVILNPVTLEETTRIWTAMEMSYRLSICYVVRVALIDSTVDVASRPVVAGTGTYGEK